MPVQTCIFDLGNVLLFFSHELMVQNMAAVGSTQLACHPAFRIRDPPLASSELRFQLPLRFRASRTVMMCAPARGGR